MGFERPQESTVAVQENSRTVTVDPSSHVRVGLLGMTFLCLVAL
jgi:hypothetical protein